jgi:hypothetical protein
VSAEARSDTDLFTLQPAFATVLRPSDRELGMANPQAIVDVLRLGSVRADVWPRPVPASWIQLTKAFFSIWTLSSGLTIRALL